MRRTDRKFKILHITSSLVNGGAQMMLLKVLSGIDRSVFESAVISLTQHGPVADKIDDLGIPTACAGMKNGLPDPISIFRLVKMAKDFKPDLIQGWMCHGNIASQFANAFLPEPVPVLWNIRQSIYDLNHEKRLTAFLIRLGARISSKPRLIIYNSFVSAVQHEGIGYVSKKTKVIPNCFDTNLFCPSQAARVQIREELGLLPSALVIGLVARYDPIKHHGNFLKSAALLLKSHPDVHFLMVGKYVDENNLELMELIKNLGLEEKTRLLGDREDLPRITAALDIAANTSYSESFSNAVGEGMACAVPVTVTDVGDSALLVGDTGKVVPPRDSEALAHVWNELIELGHERRCVLGEKARDRIVNKFSIKEIVSEYESSYWGILRGQAIHKEPSMRAEEMVR